MAVIQTLPLGVITSDARAQSRVSLDPDTVAEYAEAMRAGAEFPPLVVYCADKVFWLSEGFHRVAAALVVGVAHFACEVRQGDLRDAILNSVGANSEHGLRRSNADKLRAVTMMLTDPLVKNHPKTGAPLSAREVAAQCGVAHSFVNRVRSSLDSESSDKVSYTNKHGSVSKMKTGGIGKKKPVADPPAPPEARPDEHAPQVPAGEVIPFPQRPDAPEDPAAIEEEQIAAEFGPLVPGLEPGSLKARALSINGALSKFEHFPLTGVEYWTVYGNEPQRGAFWEWVLAAKRTVDDIIKEQPNASLHAQGQRAPEGPKKRKRLPKGSH